MEKINVIIIKNVDIFTIYETLFQNIINALPIFCQNITNMLRKSRKIESLVFQNRLLKDAHSVSDVRLFLFNQFRLRQESKVQGSLVRNDIAVISSYFPGLWKGIRVLIISDSLSLRLKKLVHCRWKSPGADAAFERS